MILITIYKLKWKNCMESERLQRAIRRMNVVCWLPKATNIHLLIICDTYYYLWTRIFTWRPFSVTLYVHFLSFLIIWFVYSYCSRYINKYKLNIFSYNVNLFIFRYVCTDLHVSHRQTKICQSSPPYKKGRAGLLYRNVWGRVRNGCMKHWNTGSIICIY